MEATTPTTISEYVGEGKTISLQKWGKQFAIEINYGHTSNIEYFLCEESATKKYNQLIKKAK